MGTSVITVRITGNHGCQRDKKHGEVIEDCGSQGVSTARRGAS